MSKQDFSPIVTLTYEETDQENASLPRSLDPEWQEGGSVQETLDSLGAIEPAEVTSGAVTLAEYWHDTPVDGNNEGTYPG
jgi:hypothetical protein